MSRIYTWGWLLVFAIGCDQCWGVTPHDLYYLGEEGVVPCTLDSDCGDGDACEGQECVIICADDDDCLAEEVCEEGVNTQHLVCRPRSAEDDIASDAGLDARTRDASSDAALEVDGG